MKNALVVFLSLFLLSVSMPSQAQIKGKLGHINMNDLMTVIPGRDSATKAFEAYAKSLDDQLTMMTNEFQTKYQDYLSTGDTLLEPIRKAREQELVNMQNTIEEYKTSAQEQMSKKELELIQPLYDKAKKAIDEVALEKGYTYVFDTSTNILIVYPESDDIMPFVKEKLGIK